MTQQHIQLNTQDRAVFAALDDDFAVSEDGLSATVTGNMKFTVTRSAAGGIEQYKLKLELPSGEPFEMNIRRAQLVDQFTIRGDALGGDES
jgi:hypothetical protein